MSPSDATDASHRRKFKLYSFLSFWVTSIVTAYLVVFFEDRGLTKSQIGWLHSFQYLAAAGVPVLWGMVSDASRDRRMPLLVAFLASAVSFTAFYWCDSFVAFLLVMVVFASVFRGLTPMGTAIVFEHVEPTGGDYSRIRLYGTAGYVAALGVMYFALRGDNTKAIFPWYLVFTAAGVAGLMMLPKLRGTGRRRLDWGALNLLRERNFGVYLVSVFATHAAFAGHGVFFSLYVRDLGVPVKLIGSFWAFAAAVELVMFLYAGRLIKRFGTKWVLASGLAATAVRLTVYATLPYVWVILPVEGLHAFTFGAMHASTATFVNYTAPTKWRASAQTLFIGGASLGTCIGAVASGQISQAWSYRVLFGWAAVVAAAATVFFSIFAKRISLVRRTEEQIEQVIAEKATREEI